MTPRATLGSLSIDEWIDTLIGAEESEGRTGPELSDQIQNAAEEFDRRTAALLARCLVEGLCDHPSDVRRLESLLILGIAHPPVLRKYRISLIEEGRRLAALLENRGDAERARGVLEVLAQHAPEAREVEQDLAGVLRRNGDVGEMVERYLRRAEEAAADGRHKDAINALQEVLLHDRTRRDVARMIRDLRYEQMECRRRTSRRHRLAVGAMAVAGLLSSLALRERQLHEEYRSLPGASDIASGEELIERHARLEEMLVENRLWLGGLARRGEIRALGERVVKLEGRVAEKARAEALERERRRLVAEASREHGLLAIQNGELQAALAHMRRSAANAAEDWEHSPRVLADLAALEAFIEEGP
ncbi:MAG: hypothetical protein QF903_02835 [Planctomycetota bacterium]|jgi:hypothetical protein|nr:hypothetical protein [Planctomycetota bacterium]MDP6761723.1 hypothetical protein [Planctomycetota bacterium]MDP6988396.1 hypothetical protein [Planctomycetota bacterium]